MAFDGTDPCWVPTLPVSEKADWRLRVAQFGDGYSQRTLDGINALGRTWSVTFENRPDDVIQAMEAFLLAQQAKAFLYLDQPTGVTYRVFCDSWQVDWSLKRKVRGGTPIHYGTLSADFVKANGIGI